MRAVPPETYVGPAARPARGFRWWIDAAGPYVAGAVVGLLVRDLPLPVALSVAALAACVYWLTKGLLARRRRGRAA